jgi:hypothetical protein
LHRIKDAQKNEIAFSLSFSWCWTEDAEGMAQRLIDDLDLTRFSHELCQKGLHPPVDASECCDCVEKDESVIFRYHNEATCQQIEHGNGHFHFKKDGYFKVTRPVWKHDCRNVNDAQVVERFYNVFKLKCLCTTHYTCTFCHYILGNESFGPIFSVNKTTFLELWMLDKMFPHLIPEVSSSLAVAE